ncbi:MarR family winged helix-turn-helix transcriptional regulator [Mangrovimicrobium sediminis]|nr:MarR family transcriptional regulator [Haliea sp. SAOS-164]
MPTRKSEYGTALSESRTMEDDDWKIRLGFVIHDCARLRRIVIDQYFAPLNVTRSQAWVLAHLSPDDGLPQSALAEQMGLGKVALGGLVDRVEANGMVERRPDPKDRRVKRVYLTDEGRKVVTEMRKRTLEASVGILDEVSMKDLRTTVTTMNKIKHNLRKMVE